MAKRMLVDASHSEETRVVVLDGTRLEELDFETAAKVQLKGNIYLAKVTRVEPSLQAAFVDYGGNRHGFLAFSEIHSDYYKVPVADREQLAADEARRSAPIDNGDENGDDTVAEDPEEETHHPDAAETAEAKDAAEENGEPATDSQADEATEGHDQIESDHPESEPEAAAGPEAEVGEPAASEDQSEHSGTDSEASAENAETADAEASEDSGEPETSGPEVVETDASADSIETVGGDDIEEETASRQRHHRRSYKIQEVIKRRQIMLVQVTKEERGNKGAALTTYLSLAGRYCVLMPNTPRGGGISRKISNPKERKRMKAILDALDVPEGMAVILRTAGLERTKAEIKRDLDYLLRLWDSIRELTLKSTAPTLIHEEANLIKRAERDLYSKDIAEILVSGEESYRTAKDFMRMLMPSHAKKVKLYKDETIPLFHRYQVEGQIDAMHSPTVQLKSGGYLVINPTEALVAIDVNSGRSTRERNIEETAYRTNLEAAEEIARQLRLRDLAGLIVIDFIDMEEDRHNAGVERRLKEAMKTDRARIQVGRISPFGLLEMSRQRLRPSFAETHFDVCDRCGGTGHVRSVGSSALRLLRAIEEEGLRRRAAELILRVPTDVALYVLNQKRDALADIEARYDVRVLLERDDSLVRPDFHLERRTPRTTDTGEAAPGIDFAKLMAEADEALASEAAEEAAADDAIAKGKAPKRSRRPRRREQAEAAPAEDAVEADVPETVEASDDGGDDDKPKKRRRRGKRGGRRRSEPRLDAAGEEIADAEDSQGDGDAQEDDGEEQTTALSKEPPVEAPDGDSEPTADTAADGAPPPVVEAAKADRPAPVRRRSRSRRIEKEAEAPAAEAAPAEPRAVEEPAADLPIAVDPAITEADQSDAGHVEAPDETPEPPPQAPAYASDATPAEEDTNGPAINDPHQLVNVPPEKPKRGWWQRLLD